MHVINGQSSSKLKYTTLEKPESCDEVGTRKLSTRTPHSNKTAAKPRLWDPIGPQSYSGTVFLSRRLRVVTLLHYSTFNECVTARESSV